MNNRYARLSKLREAISVDEEEEYLKQVATSNHPSVPPSSCVPSPLCGRAPSFEFICVHGQQPNPALSPVRSPHSQEQERRAQLAAFHKNIKSGGVVSNID